MTCAHITAHPAPNTVGNLVEYEQCAVLVCDVLQLLEICCHDSECKAVHAHITHPLTSGWPRSRPLPCSQACMHSHITQHTSRLQYHSRHLVCAQQCFHGCDVIWRARQHLVPHTLRHAWMHVMVIRLNMGTDRPTSGC